MGDAGGDVVADQLWVNEFGCRVGDVDPDLAERFSRQVNRTDLVARCLALNSCNQGLNVANSCTCRCSAGGLR